MNRVAPVILLVAACTGRTGFELLPGAARGDVDRGDSQSTGGDSDPGDGDNGGPIEIYRSVGPHNELPLAVGDGSVVSPLTISGDVATFGQALPDRVGVGDAIEFDANDDGVVESIVFVHGRLSSTQLRVCDASGALPPQTAAADADWRMFRAYTSLHHAATGTTSWAISVSYDEWSDNRDLVANDEVWNIALYADDVDTNWVDIEGWTTSARNYLRLFTPVAASEVGVSQRHDGAWGSGYRRILPLQLSVSFARLDGLSARVSGTSYFIVDVTGGGEIDIANCFGHYIGAIGSSRPYDIYRAGSLRVRLWNNIGISDSTDVNSVVFYLNSSDAVVYAYNNTAVVNGGAGFHKNGGSFYSRNNLAYVYGTGVGFSTSTTSFDLMEHCASSDASAGNFGGTNYPNQAFTFLWRDGDNYALRWVDTGAIDEGVDLSQDPDLAFDVDIHGDLRPSSAWDIGADEFVFVGMAATISTPYPTNVGPDGFDLILPVDGDDDFDAAATFRFCNRTDDPGCDPTAEPALHMVREGHRFVGRVSGLAATSEPFDEYQVVSMVDDPDGVVAGPLSGVIALGTPIHRSVGVDSLSALATGGGNPVTVADGVAAFTSALPLNIGLGDVLHYADSDGVVEVVVFVHGRVDSTHFEVRRANGREPLDTGANDSWAMYRAYTSLHHAESGLENAGIPVQVRDFDTWEGGTDLIASRETWHIALYADDVDNSYATVRGWTTSPNNSIRIFTPVSVNEVGTSQRHAGVWGSGYQRIESILVHESYVDVEGVASRNDNASAIFINETDDGVVNVSSCYGEYTGSGSTRVFDIWRAGTTTVRLWNNIAINNSMDADARAFLCNSSSATCMWHNNTALANGGWAYKGGGPRSTLRNNLGVVTGAATAFEGPFGVIEHCASSDDTAAAWGGTNNHAAQAILFVDQAGGDLHLAASDAGAAELGADLSMHDDLSLTDDIDQQTRPRGTLWDIGADER